MNLKFSKMVIFLILILITRNKIVMDQLIPFHKPNKKLKSEMLMNYFIPQTKHPAVVILFNQKKIRNLQR